MEQRQAGPLEKTDADEVESVFLAKPTLSTGQGHVQQPERAVIPDGPLGDGLSCPPVGRVMPRAIAHSCSALASSSIDRLLLTE